MQNVTVAHARKLLEKDNVICSDDQIEEMLELLYLLANQAMDLEMKRVKELKKPQTKKQPSPTNAID